MRVSIDSDKCIGSGNCENAAPAVFRLDDAGLAQLLDATPGEGLSGWSGVPRWAAQPVPLLLRWVQTLPNSGFSYRRCRLSRDASPWVRAPTPPARLPAGFMVIPGQKNSVEFIPIP